MVWMFTMVSIISTNLLTGLAISLVFALLIKMTSIHVPWAKGMTFVFGIGRY